MKAAATPPAPGPNVRRDSQAATGIVSVPAPIDTRIAARSLTPNTRYDRPTSTGKPGRSVRDDRRIDAGQSSRRQAPKSCKRVDSFVKVDEPEPARRPETDHGTEQRSGR